MLNGNPASFSLILHRKTLLRSVSSLQSKYCENTLQAASAVKQPNPDQISGSTRNEAATRLLSVGRLTSRCRLCVHPSLTRNAEANVPKKLVLGICGCSRPQVQVNGLQPRPARHGGRRTEAEPRAPPSPPSILSTPAGAVPSSSRRRFPGAASGPGAGLGQGDGSSAGKEAGCSSSSRRGVAGTPGEGHRAGPAAPAIARRLPELRLPPREPPRLSEPPGEGGSEHRPDGEGKRTAAARSPTSPRLA